MIVLDASAWIDVLTAGLDIPELAQADLYVPPHFDVEVTVSIRALAQRGEIDPADADLSLDRHLRGTFRREFDPDDVQHAWRLRESMSLADAWYVALAQRLGATWVTADQRAGRTARRMGVAVSVV